MAVDAVVDVFQRVAAIRPDLPLNSLLQHQENFTVAVLKALDSIVERYDSLKRAELSSRHRLETLIKDLKQAVEAACEYVRRVGDLMWYGGNVERIRNIKEGIERNDFTPLTEFIEQLRTTYLVTAESSCQKAARAFEDVHSSALQLATDCRERGQEAKTRKTFTRAAGAAVGTATMIIVGGCTFGIGTLVGLGVIVGSAAATHTISSDLAEREREFIELSQSCDGVISSASSMLDYTRTIKMYLESISEKIAIVNRTMEAHEVHFCLTSAFNGLCQRFDGLDTPTYRERLRAINEEFQAQITEQLHWQMNMRY